MNSLMESNFNISTKVNRVSMPTQNKVDTVMKNLGHRPCVAYSEERICIIRMENG